MKVKVSSDALLSPLRIAASPCQANSPEKAVSHLLLRAGGKEGLTLAGSDRESVVSTFGIEAAVSGKGEVAVPSRQLVDLCSRLPGAELELEITGSQKLRLSSRAGTYLIHGVAPDAAFTADIFAQNQDGPALASFDMPTDLLAWVLERVTPCMASSDWRSYLLGALLEVDGKELRGVSTDGHRMGFARAALTKAAKHEDSPVQALVPRRAVALARGMLRALSGEEGGDEEAPKPAKKSAAKAAVPSAKVEIAADRVRISTPNATFSTLLINSKFPEYEKVLPKGEGFQPMKVDREGLEAALGRAMVVAERDNGVTLRLEGGKLQVSTKPRQDGAKDDAAGATEFLDAEYAGGAHEVTFNAQYLLDALRNITTDLVEWHLYDPKDSVELREAGNDAVRFIVMPLRN